MTTADPIITAARDHAEARRDVLAAIAASLPPDQLASAAVDLAVLAREDRDEARSQRDESDGLRAAACNEIDRLTAHLETATADAERQRNAACDLRAALDRVAVAAGVDTDSTGAIVADRVIAVIRAMQARPVLTVERLADALRAANVTLEPSTTALIAMSTMGTMSHMGDIVLLKTAALPADLRAYLETRRDRLQGGHGLGLAAEIAALNRWLALPTAEVTP